MGIADTSPDQHSGHKSVITGSQIRVLLADPYHFRKQGVYQLRVRPRGSCKSCTVSLRTTERSAAMKTSKLLQSTLRVFHLDNPEASWEELRERLRVIAEDMLQTPTEWDRLEDQALLYSDWQSDLRAFIQTAPLSVPQAKAAVLGRRITQAAQRKLVGDPGTLVELIEELNKNDDSNRVIPDPVSLSVSAPSAPSLGTSTDNDALTFETLSETYRKEHRGNITESTFNGLLTNHKVIAEALDSLDLRTHTRADLVALRDALLSGGRKASTVNNLLSKLSTVLRWAENNDLIKKAYIQNLKIKKGAGSTRKAYTPDQVARIMQHANSLPKLSWKRWALSLAVITGARLNEIIQLTKDDIKTLDSGIVVIDINDNDGKHLKTAQSERQVPLTDGAYGFDLGAFLEFVATGTKATVLGIVYENAGRQLNTTLRELAGGDDPDLTLHSLRHSLTSLLQAEGVPVAYVQEILGQSSRTLAFETYGSGVPVEKLAVVLRESLLPQSQQTSS